MSICSRDLDVYRLDSSESQFSRGQSLIVTTMSAKVSQKLSLF